jgi:hypothetical protein
MTVTKLFKAKKQIMGLVLMWLISLNSLNATDSLSCINRLTPGKIGFEYDGLADLISVHSTDLSTVINGMGGSAVYEPFFENIEKIGKEAQEEILKHLFAKANVTTLADLLRFEAQAKDNHADKYPLFYKDENIVQAVIKWRAAISLLVTFNGVANNHVLNKIPTPETDTAIKCLQLSANALDFYYTSQRQITAGADLRTGNLSPDFLKLNRKSAELVNEEAQQILQISKVLLAELRSILNNAGRRN